MRRALFLIALCACACGESGAVEESCPAGGASCGEQCVDVAVDPDNCGECGHTCKGVGIGCFAGACTSPAWLSRPRVAHAVVVGPDGRIYAIGGGSFGGPHAAVEAYDPSANAWSEVASLHQPRGLLGAATHNGKIWAFGGTSAAMTRAVEVFDPEEDRWSAGPALSIARSDAPFVVTPDETIRTIWGYSKAGRVFLDGVPQWGPAWPLQSADVLSGDGPWQIEDLRSGPTPRWGARAVAGLDGKIYLLGGLRSHMSPPTVSGAVDVFDPASGTWSTGRAMLRARGLGAAALGADGRIYYFGGWDDRGGLVPTSDSQAYDPANDTWTLVAALPAPRGDTHAVALADGRIYIVGGGVASGGSYYSATASAVVYDPKRDLWFW